MNRIFIVSQLIGLIIGAVSCNNSHYEKLADGVIVRLNGKPESETRAIKVQIINDKIIHVIASAVDSFSRRPSLMIVPQKSFALSWQLEEKDDNLIIKTASVIVSVSNETGEVKFKSSDGTDILNEVSGGGKQFNAAKVDEEKMFRVRQIFDSPDDEAFYGLGQHQNDEMNYKGEDVNLTQVNSVAVVPFVMSSKNYGILWDNYSITKFGDPREYKPISSLKLFNKAGEEGGLTATYTSKYDSSKVFLSQIEKEIGIEFLSDQQKIPKGFDLQSSKVTWRGYIQSSESGLHKFLSTYAGYAKIWLNGKLVMDKWRQAWNPNTGKFSLELEKEKKYPIKIEWIPDGGQSYLTLKWLSPQPEVERKRLSLYSEAADQIDYYFIQGTDMDDVIHGYRTLTGKAPIVPKWAMGLWQSRERYKTQDEILSVVKEFRKRKIPLDNIVLDWQYWTEDKWGSQEFDAVRFPDPVAMIKDMHEKYHTRFMISVWPKFYEGAPNYELFDKNGWLYKQNIKLRNKDWVGPGYVSTFYDAFNPQARKAFWNIIHDNLFTKGVDAWWMDATEPDILSNSTIEERKQLMNPTALGSSTRYFNAFSIVNALGIYEGQRAAAPNQRVFILTRSAYAGLQRYSAATWSGDVGATWSDMKSQISAGVNFSMSGIPYWSMDIGGFSVERRFENATGEDLAEWREQITRWYQFGSFCPLFRAHGQYPYREIYNTAPENHVAYQSMLYYDQLRYRLMPYLYSLVGKTYFQDYTIMRGLVMDFESDVKARNINDQFMMGPSLLINPVTQYKATSRQVYLPATSGWYDLQSGKYFEGNQTINADAPVSRIPVFVKEGSILPFGPAIQYTDEKPADPITLYVYTGKDGKFDIYEDDGNSYSYEKGEFSTIPLTYNDAAHTLVIGNRLGAYPGMIQKRVFRIVWISKERPRELNFNSIADAEITYEGKEQTVSQVINRRMN